MLNQTVFLMFMYYTSPLWNVSLIISVPSTFIITMLQCSKALFTWSVKCSSCLKDSLIWSEYVQSVSCASCLHLLKVTLHEEVHREKHLKEMPLALAFSPTWDWYCFFNQLFYLFNIFYECTVFLYCMFASTKTL